MTFSGKADITENAFIEQGDMKIEGGKFDSRRRYALKMETGHVTVEFADGGHFIRLASEASQRVVHVCGDDVYTGRFIVAGPDRWAEVWSVQGPKKRYRSLTIYRRQGQVPTPA